MIRVLLAEDDPDIQRVVRLALRDDFEVTVANNDREALARVAETRPHLILLDWMMPELNGPETCAHLKSDPETRDIPIAFLTARSQEAEISRGLALGAIGYLTKPFDAHTLSARIRQLLDR